MLPTFRRTAARAKIVAMYRRYRYRLYPNATQAAALASVLETHRRVYNDALAQRKEAYAKTGKTPTRAEQWKVWSRRRNEAVESLRRGEPGPHWLAHISAISMRDTLKRLDDAYQAFFKRLKVKPSQPGQPRFRSRKRFNSIPWNNYLGGANLLNRSGRRVDGKMANSADPNGFRLRVFGVGVVRVKLHRPIDGKIKTVTVQRSATGKWYVTFACDLGEITVQRSDNPPVGVDLGLEHFLTTSDGEHTPNPRYLAIELPELRRRQRSLRRKTLYGKNWSKSRHKVASVYERITNLRKEFHRAVAHKLIRKYGVICAEALNIQGLLKNGKLARHILDAGWGGFLSALKGIAEKAGVRVVEVDARHTSQTCSTCGHCEANNRKTQAAFRCRKCGHSENADINAARNILRRGCPESTNALREPARVGPAGDNRKGLSAGRPRRFALRHRKPNCQPVRTPTLPGLGADSDWQIGVHR